MREHSPLYSFTQVSEVRKALKGLKATRLQSLPPWGRLGEGTPHA